MSTVEMRSGTGTNECWQPPVWCAIGVTDEPDFLLFGVGFSLLCDTLLQNARSDYHLTA